MRAPRLRAGEAQHLNDIAKRWFAAKKQERTSHDKNRTVTIEMKPIVGDEFVLAPRSQTSPVKRSQGFEERECDTDVVGSLGSGRMLLFVPCDGDTPSNWIADQAKLSKVFGIKRNVGEPVASGSRFLPQTRCGLWTCSALFEEPPLYGLAKGLRHRTVCSGPRGRRHENTRSIP